jgi:hypothetical protein
MSGRKTILVLLMMFVSLLMIGSSTVLGAILEIPIANNNSDAEQHLNDNRMDLGSSDLEIPFEDGGVPPTDAQVVGVRYAVDIPQGTAIISAHLELQADKADKDGTLEPVNVIIQGELSPDAALFANVANNITDRPTTVASVMWSIEPYTEIGQRVQSPDLTAIIQEIVNQDGWSAGNGLALIISDDPNNPSTGLRESEAGPGDDSATLVIEAFIPFARNPIPANGAVEVKDLAAAQWTAADSAVSYNIYISGDDTIDANDLVGAVTDTEFVLPEAPVPGMTYYWRVDAVDANDVVFEGAVWNVTTYPLEAHFPSPHDGALWVKTDAILSWTEGLDALVHNMYFSEDQALVEARDPNIATQWLSVPEFNPGALLANTTYFWAVDEFLGAETNPGPIWSFTTGDPNDGGVLAQYWDNMNLAGAPVLVTTEAEVNWDFNAERNSQPHPDVPVVDNFSCRWTADLQIPVSGAYTFYVASDDGSRLFLNGEEIIGTNWSDHGTVEAGSAPLDLAAGEFYLLEMEMYENGGGATAYLRWEGPGIPKQIIPQGALQIPDIALYPTPADMATGVADMPVLSWIAGEGAVQADVYLGTDMDLVAAGDASVYLGRVGDPNDPNVAADSIEPGDLPWNTVYYWRVDSVTADGTVIPAGFVWEFTTEAARVLEDFSSYDIDPMAPTVGPIAQYLFEGDANDTSGSGLHGMIVDGQIVTYGDANEAMAIQLDIGGYVDLGNPPELDFATGDWTISAWINTTMTGTGDANKGTIYAKGGDTGGGKRIALILSESKEGVVSLVCDDDDNKRQAHANTPVNDGQWHFILGQREGTEIRIFIDGVLETTTSVDAEYDLSGTAQHNAYIGAVTDHNSEGESPLYKLFGGLIDEVQVYDYALSAQEVASFVPNDNLVSGAWGAGIIVDDPNEGQVLCLVDGDVASATLATDVQGADTLTVMVAGDGTVGVTVEDAAGATSTATAAAAVDYQAVMVALGGLDTTAIATVTVTATGGTVYVAEVKVSADHQVILVNPSFELPGLDKKPGFGDVPGWSTDSEPVASGVEPRYQPTDGNWTAYLKGRDPAIWNLTNQIIRGEGDTFTLTLDARRIVTGSGKDGAQKLKIALYYDDAGTRVPLVTKTVGLKTGMKTFSIAFTAPADSPAIGQSLGIELLSTATLYVGVDNLNMVRDYAADFDN